MLEKILKDYQEMINFIRETGNEDSYRDWRLSDCVEDVPVILGELWDTK